MTINILDLIAYIVIVILLYFIIPRQYKEEIGALAVIFIMVIFTIVYVILFVFIDYDMYDVLISLITYVKTNVKLKL